MVYNNSSAINSSFERFAYSYWEYATFLSHINLESEAWIKDEIAPRNVETEVEWK